MGTKSPIFADDIQNSDLPSNHIRAIAADHLGGIWIGTNEGLAYFDQVSWTIYDTLTSGLPDNVIRCLEIGPGQKLWAGTANGGLCRLAFDSIIVFDSSSAPLVDNFIRAVESDEDGNIWVASFLKFYRYDGINWETFDGSNSGISSEAVNSFAASLNGQVYFATHHGFSRLSQSEWERFYAFESGLPDNIAEVVVVDEEGTKWIGTFGGVAIFNESGI